MRSLLDVNVLIALFDPDHVNHERAHAWWRTHRAQGWSSCPMTENGLIRIVSNPRYSSSRRFRPAEIIANLSTMVENSDHQFWSDDLSLRDRTAFVHRKIHGPSQLSDLYLLALATSRAGRLATFDRDIPLSAINGATEENLCVL